MALGQGYGRHAVADGGARPGEECETGVSTSRPDARAALPSGYSGGDMETRSHTVYPDLLAETAVPPRGILSQTLSNADGVELVLFAFAAGEALGGAHVVPSGNHPRAVRRG